MANTSSAKKAAKQAEKRNLINKARKSRIHTFLRKVEENIKIGNEEEARKSYKALEPEIMRGVTKKALKLNTAARTLRKLAEKIRKIKKA